MIMAIGRARLLRTRSFCSLTTSGVQSAVCSDLRFQCDVISEVEEAVLGKYFHSLFLRKKYEGTAYFTAIIDIFEFIKLS